ncbi:hypothetical protein ANO11243_076760 [Dothideomycetidae sp. 11243]|nr:hypothetical protein ANO11243_076760 [fungal sp. No.11243]
MPQDAWERRHRGPLSRAGTAYVRTRAVTACQVCRARRAKCDNERPCANCRRIGATCSSEPAATTAGFDPASLAILAQLRELKTELGTLSGRLHGSIPRSPAIDGQGSVISAQDPLLRLEHHLQCGNLHQVLAWDIWQPQETPHGRYTGDEEFGHGSRAQTPDLDLDQFPGYLDAFFHNVHILNPVLDEQQTRTRLTNFLLNVLANGAASSAFGNLSTGLATCQTMAARPHEASDRVSQSQAEQSIYWSCWKSERELRFELDVPDFGTTTGYDHPTLFPTLPSQVSDQEQLRAWYFYLAEISLWRFEMTARQTMAECAKQHPSSSEALAERTEDLDMTLASWQNSLPGEIRLENNSSADDVLLFVLRGRLTYYHEVLTWPFLETLLLFGSSAHRSSARTTELAARGVRMHYDRLAINRPGFFHRHHGTWLMQRSSTRSAFVLLAVSRSSSADLLPTGWQTLVSDTIAMLEYWSDGGSGDEVIAFLRNVVIDVVQ